MNIAKSETFRLVFKSYINDCRFMSACPVLETFAHIFYQQSSSFTNFLVQLDIFFRSLKFLGLLPHLRKDTIDVNEDLLLECNKCHRSEVFDNQVIYFDEDEVLSLILGELYVDTVNRHQDDVHRDNLNRILQELFLQVESTITWENCFNRRT